VLVDIKPGVAEGKAMDIWQSAPIDRFNARTVGVTNDYIPTANSNVVVITSGLPRKPGMTRDDLIETNATIVKSVTENIVQYSPCSVIIVVSNPLDVMTYQAHLTSRFPRTRVIGMAGILDTGRYKAFIAELTDKEKEQLNESAKAVKEMMDVLDSFKEKSR
jgi:malate dehydrogenase